MAYLVTGGTGFIGSYVVRDLIHEGKEVVCLQRSGITPIFRGVVGEDNDNKVKIVQGDLSNTLQLFNLIREYNIEVVAHIGFILMSGGVSEAQPAYTLQVNCVGMNNLLEAARLLGVRKIVWTSSSQALGRVGQYYQEPIKDDALYMPDSMYSATKVLDEYMSRLYYERFGVDSLGFRIGFILGVDKVLGRGGSFTKFLRDAATDVPVTMAAMEADRVRALGYVENVSDLIVKACEAPTTKTRTFNAADYLCSCRQLVESMCQANPNAQITLKDGVSPDEATWGGAPSEPLLDTSGIRTEFGWKPKYSLEEALTKIFNHFRRQEGLPLL